MTQNLFYVAKLSTPKSTAEVKVPRQTTIILGGAYCACLIIAPLAKRTTWLIPLILIARSFLLVPLNFSLASETATNNAETPDHTSPWTTLALPVSLAITGQLFVATLDYQSLAPLGRALFSHPAVASLGCDFILSILSTAVWTVTQRAATETGDAKQR